MCVVIAMQFMTFIFPCKSYASVLQYNFRKIHCRDCEETEEREEEDELVGRAKKDM